VGRGGAPPPDPDSRDAYLRKLAFLSPTWYGSDEESIAFGRECLATGNWRAGIPQLLLTAHRSAAERSGDRKAYYEQPRVWEDVSSVYEGQLANFPEDAKARNEYAMAAARCGKWDVVRAQFELLGDRVNPDSFGGKTTLDYYRRKAVRLGGAAGAAATMPATAPAR
jgi:hypothetical protein